MNNHATTEGNHNIIIQGVTDSTITLNVNGATQEIEKKLDTLLGLLQQQKTFQVADKIYNIGSISNANFDFVLGQSNQANVLPQELADNLITESNQWVESLYKALLKKGVSVRRRPMDIFQHYGGMIEVFLQKMETGVGKELSLRRLSFMSEVFQSSLRYLCFIQFAQMTELKTKPKHLLFADFFLNTSKEKEQFDYLSCLIVLSDALAKEEIAFIPEISDFVTELKNTESDLYATALFLEKNRLRLINNEIATDEHLLQLLDEYLTALAFWLREIAFLAKYRLVSVKDINLDYRMGMGKNFVHLYGELHGMYNQISDGEQDYQSIAIPNSFTFNQSILLFKGGNVADGLSKIEAANTYISLSPLLIDRSVMEAKATQTPEIFYFSGFEQKNKIYTYSDYRNEPVYGENQSILSNKTLEIQRQNNKNPKLNELFEQLEHVFLTFKTPIQ
jgi:hypothetical protein